VLGEGQEYDTGKSNRDLFQPAALSLEAFSKLQVVRSVRVDLVTGCPTPTPVNRTLAAGTLVRLYIESALQSPIGMYVGVGMSTVHVVVKLQALS
jgi:hypothetical protein